VLARPLADDFVHLGAAFDACIHHRVVLVAGQVLAPDQL
jgi:hypothetical protein